jgi:hypothetical protein
MPIRLTVLGACAGALVLCAPLCAGVAGADPAEQPAIEPAAADAPPPPDGAPPPPPLDDGRVASAPPQTLTTPDGWTLTISSKDEMQMPIAPLTTAVSSREYSAGGTFTGRLEAPDGESPRGVLEVGFQIGCGIDMSTSNGVVMNGSIGLNSGLGFSGPLGALPTGVAPIFSVPITGGIAVALKPGLVNTVPVVKKEFKGPDPWVMVSNFHIKIDGCVGQSFLRSYAVLTRSTDQSDVVLGYYGLTKIV